MLPTHMHYEHLLDVLQVIHSTLYCNAKQSVGEILDGAKVALLICLAFGHEFLEDISSSSYH
jgi:hypothetical protein